MSFPPDAIEQSTFFCRRPAHGDSSQPLMILRLVVSGRHKGGMTRAEELGHEGYSEMGRKGGLTTNDKSGEERAQEEGIEIDESKFRKDQE